jgi:TolB-like protein/cytochrome c-type biogenesis protein CcmH/NrfG
MATGRQAFAGSTSAIIFDSILHAAPDPPTRLKPSLPPELDRIVDKALAKLRGNRYQTAADFRADLRRLKQETDSGRAAAAGAKAAGDKGGKSVAVLYFENLSNSAEDEYFRDGMTEDIITELLGIQGLEIFPRATVLAYRNKQVTPAEIAQHLGAAYVLGGSLRRAGNRLRITAQLVETRSGRSVWGERYDRELKDVFEVQDEIARKITEALRITLSTQEKANISRKPTENAQAYDFYLRGKSYTRQQNVEFALQMFEHAVKLDPNFALAHAGIANVCGIIHEFREQQPKWIERGLAACNRALALEPSLAEALAARARLFYAEKKFEDAIRYAWLAIERKKDCEHSYNILGRSYFAAGRYQDAVKSYEQAVEANGDDYNLYIPYLLSFEKLGLMDESRKVRERHSPVLEKQIELVPEDVRARILLASNYAALGNSDDAIRHLETAVALRPNDTNVLYNAACTYGILNRKAEALETVKKAIEAGYGNLEWIARDPDLRCLQDDPEFQRLITGKSAKV